MRRPMSLMEASRRPAQPVLEQAPIPPPTATSGMLTRYREEIAHGLDPEDMRIQTLEFEGVVDAAGVVVLQPEPVRIDPEYKFFLRRIKGWIMSPEVNTSNASLITFQIRELGRDRDIFRTPPTLAGIIPGFGGEAFEYVGGYNFFAGSEIRITFAVKPAAFGLPGWIAPGKRFAVVLLGDEVRVNVLAR